MGTAPICRENEEVVSVAGKKAKKLNRKAMKNIKGGKKFVTKHELGPAYGVGGRD